MLVTIHFSCAEIKVLKHLHRTAIIFSIQLYSLHVEQHEGE